MVYKVPIDLSRKTANMLGQETDHNRLPLASIHPTLFCIDLSVIWHRIPHLFTFFRDSLASQCVKPLSPPPPSHTYTLHFSGIYNPFRATFLGGGGLIFEGQLEKADRSFRSAFFVAIRRRFSGVNNARNNRVMWLFSPPRNAKFRGSESGLKRPLLFYVNVLILQG